MIEYRKGQPAMTGGSGLTTSKSTNSRSFGIVCDGRISMNWYGKFAATKNATIDRVMMSCRRRFFQLIWAVIFADREAGSVMVSDIGQAGIRAGSRRIVTSKTGQPRNRP
ncbi:MAG: hypothetical protein AAF958_09135 [Planctomycetota bacterium]